MFVGLARDRFDSLISSPSATLAAHARTLALLLVIFANDVACIMLFMSNHGEAPLSHLTLWLFDTVVAGLEAGAIMVKYGEPLILLAKMILLFVLGPSKVQILTTNVLKGH